MFNSNTFTVNLKRANESNNHGESNAKSMLDECDKLSKEEAFREQTNCDYSLTQDEFETIQLQGSYKVIKTTERVVDEDNAEVNSGDFNIVYIDFTRRF